MPKSSLFCFRVFVLFLFTACGALKKDLVLCADCNKEGFDICETKLYSGYYVAPNGTLETRYSRSSLLPPLTSDLDVCIPRNMKIDAKDDFEYICVWSRELGCQMLIPKNNKNELSCGMCQVAGVVGIPGCPCINSVINLDVGSVGKKKEKSGSRQLYPGDLHVMIAAFVVQQQVLMGLKPGGL